MTDSPRVRVARVYDEPGPGDGLRILVDRLWPRGLRKDALALDEWAQAVSPSTELRQWFRHEPDRHAEFVARYERELDEPLRRTALAHLQELAASHTVTLLTSTKDVELSHAAVLATLLRHR